MVVIPEKSGGIRITVNYKELNKISILGQLPIPRGDDVLDKLGTGRIFSLFDLVSSFNQISVHKDTIPLTAFCTSTRLFDWLVISQGRSADPGWFVKVTNEVIKGLDRVAAYLDDVIVFDADPSLHVTNMKEFFLRLRKHNRKPSPSKANIGTTHADFFGHTTSPAGIMPNAQKVEALKKRPIPQDLQQLRYLLGVLSYYRKFCAIWRSGYGRSPLFYKKASSSSYSCHGSHSAGTSRRVVHASGPRLPQPGRRHRQLPPFSPILRCQCGRFRRHPRTRAR